MESAYRPGASLPAAKPKRPSRSLTTVKVIDEPAARALTSTPSMAPSAAEVIRPVKTVPDSCARAGSTPSWRNKTRAPLIAASANFESIGLTEFHPRSILHSTSIGLLGSTFGDGRLTTRVCRYPSLAQEMVMSPGLTCLLKL